MHTIHPDLVRFGRSPTTPRPSSPPPSRRQRLVAAATAIRRRGRTARSSRRRHNNHNRAYRLAGDPARISNVEWHSSPRKRLSRRFDNTGGWTEGGGADYTSPELAGRSTTRRGGRALQVQGSRGGEGPYSSRMSRDAARVAREKYDAATVSTANLSDEVRKRTGYCNL